MESFTTEILSNALSQSQALLSRAMRSDNQAMLATDGEKLGERLRLLIEASPYNAREIARACKITPEAVYGWFKTGRIAKKHLPIVAEMVGTSIEGLLGDGAPKGKARSGELEWSFAAQKLAALFDHLPADERKLAWPWLVHMIAHSPGLVKSFLPYPVDNERVESAFGKAGGSVPKRGRSAAKGKK